MLSYINSELFGEGKERSSIDRLDRMLDEFQSDNKRLQQQISEYETKIQKLPVEIRKRIIEQQFNYGKQPSQNLSQEQYAENGLPKLSNISQNQLQIHSYIKRNAKRDKKWLQQRLSQLQEQQNQINYITQLTDTYIRCKKQYQPTNVMAQESSHEEYQSMRDKLNHQRLIVEQDEMEKVSAFIQSLKSYQSSKQASNQNTQVVNDIIQQIKLHTGKKLIQKCENLIHSDLIEGNQNIVIESYLIKNCRSIILASFDESLHNEKNVKIINKFIEKILSNLIYYDVSYQKIILLQVKSDEDVGVNKHNLIISRKKLSFAPSETDKYFENLRFTINFHVQKAQQLRNILFQESQHTSLINEFDKIVERHLSTIKSTLEYILPYINIKSRKQLMSILTRGKEEMIQFQDLVLRLKFKGQDGDMFMNNLDAVFNRLFEIKFNQQSNSQRVKFNDQNFAILASFFQLGISEAQESLLESSSKAIMKFTSGLSRKIHDKLGEKVSTKYNSKKLFNMIFFSVSNLIERFDTLLDQKSQLFQTYDEDLQQTYEQKVTQWAMKLIEIRERVRVRIHQE